jgi:hypothetical protein
MVCQLKENALKNYQRASEFHSTTTYLFTPRSLFPRCPHIHIPFGVQQSYARDWVINFARGFRGLRGHSFFGVGFVVIRAVNVVVDMAVSAVDVALEKGVGWTSMRVSSSRIKGVDMMGGVSELLTSLRFLAILYPTSLMN